MDDFLGKKKDTAAVLDLSKTAINTKEDLKKVMEKVPDFKIKPEKVRLEDFKFRNKFTFKSGKKDLKNMRQPYTFPDPLPHEMSNLKIQDLATVSIDWHMLTNQRPKSKVDEEFFSRLVELAKLELKTIAKDKKDLMSDTQIRKSKNKAGVIEVRYVSCIDCGEDLCNGKACAKLNYDAFLRVPELRKEARQAVDLSTVRKKRKKPKRKSQQKSKGKRSKSKSPKKKDKK